MRTLQNILRIAFAALALGAGVRRGAEASTPAALTPDNLIAAVGRELTAHFNLEGDLQLELLRPWTPPSRAATAWAVTVMEFPSVASSAMLVRIRLFADGQPVAAPAEGALVLRATLWRDAWAARLPLTVGGAFDPVALEARRVDLFREREVLPAAIGDRTFIFTRSVPAGRLLTWRDIARRPLVRKGDFVEVTASSGLLLVTMKAQALENGAQGETVTVRNPVSQKNFSAVVTDENRVQVRF